MAGYFKHSRHLVRMLLLYLVWVGAFLVVRSQFVPDRFGEHGHYRPAAVDEIAAQAPLFPGKASCLECHDDVSQNPALNHHATISCASCHGALAEHASDPAITPPKPTADNRLCLGCHLATPAKPAWFKQIEPVEHADGGACSECHEPHAR